jgi:hypothetical protein
MSASNDRLRDVVFRMAIEALEPNRIVRLKCSRGQPEWAGTMLEWEIEPKPAGSALKFQHRDRRAMTPYAASCNTTWGHLMFKLKAFVESGKPAPRWVE